MVRKIVDEKMDEIAATSEPAPALAAAHPLYAVDMNQCITSWNDAASEQFRAEDDVIGRRCYEVLASMDARNAALCRPNCPVIAMARTGRPSRDFEVWAQTPDGESGRVQVSILLQESEDPAQSRVVHMVRRVDDRPAPAGAATPAFRPSGRQPEAASTEFRNTITPRQVAALRLLAEGYTPDEIAASLNIRPITIRNHIQAAMDRLGARSRLEAVIIASRAGLLDEV
ncbi:MAG: LuxR C-terminal-related transcriptional regulator [Chloroflexota bacterium]